MKFPSRSYWIRLRHRLRGRRVALARRALAAGLFVVAAVLALRPGTPAPALPPPGAARAGPEAALPKEPGFATVPVHLADASVAQLLERGMRVDVVTAGAAEQAREVLASMAIVVDIRSPPTGGSLLATENKGPLVLISVPTEIAAEVAAVALRNPVAVTLR
jgi:hypothetical protein